MRINEKFNSSNLTGVLGFINKDDKKKFLLELKSLSDHFSIPLSEINDGAFSYLPFRKALALKGSDSNRYLKYWFSSNKKSYLKKTMSTNKERNIASTEGYVVIKNLKTSEDFRGINTGDDILIQTTHYSQTGFAKIFFTEIGIYKKYFAIQNFSSGEEPNSGNWREFGQYSWLMIEVPGGMSYYTKADLIEFKSSVDDYDHNFFIDANFNFMEISTKNSLVDADFCLVLNLDKLINSTQNLKVIKQRRISSKINYRLDSKDSSDFRKKNITRYINGLSNLMEKEFGEKSTNSTPKFISRIYGGKYSLFHILSMSKSEIEGIYDILYKEVENSEDYSSSKDKFDPNMIKWQFGPDKIYKWENDYTNLDWDHYDESFQFGSFSKEKFLKMMHNKFERTEVISKYVKLFQSNKYNMEIIDKMIEFSTVINNKILSTNMESLFDIEMMFHKMDSLFAFMMDGRYAIDKLFTLLSYMKSESTQTESYYESLTYTHKTSILYNLKYCEKFFNKL